MQESSGPAARGALEGIRVLEISGMGPGPFCGMVLSDFGAEVIRVDRPAEEGRRRRGGSRVTGRGRRSVTLDLKTDEGREEFLQLAGTSDVVIEGMRPGVVERLGVGPEECTSATLASSTVASRDGARRAHSHLLRATTSTIWHSREPFTTSGSETGRPFRP